MKYTVTILVLWGVAIALAVNARTYNGMWLIAMLLLVAGTLVYFRKLAKEEGGS